MKKSSKYLKELMGKTITILKLRKEVYIDSPVKKSGVVTAYYTLGDDYGYVEGTWGKVNIYPRQYNKFLSFRHTDRIKVNKK